MEIHDTYLFTSFYNGFVRLIDPTDVHDGTLILVDYEHKSPVVLVAGAQFALAPGWKINLEGTVQGRRIARPQIYTNLQFSYGALNEMRLQMQTQSNWVHQSGILHHDGSHTIVPNVATSKCDGRSIHDWKTYDSGFSRYEYCSVCDRKKS